MNQLTQTTLPQTTLAQSAFAQSTLPHYIVINMNLPSCCGSYCGVLFPLNANGAYNNPRDGGKTLVTFRLTGSSTCGIPVAKVLRGDLEGLIERDALAELNPKANSIRLRIEGYKKLSPKINTPNDKLKIEDLVRRVCDQINTFIERAEVSSGATPELTVGEGGILASRLVLVSLKRISVGSWVPCMRLVNGQDRV